MDQVCGWMYSHSTLAHTGISRIIMAPAIQVGWIEFFWWICLRELNEEYPWSMRRRCKILKKGSEIKEMINSTPSVGRDTHSFIQLARATFYHHPYDLPLLSIHQPTSGLYLHSQRDFPSGKKQDWFLECWTVWVNHTIVRMSLSEKDHPRVKGWRMTFWPDEHLWLRRKEGTGREAGRN
jgi:hypothetical protein